MDASRRYALLLMPAIAAAVALPDRPARAASAREIDREASAALRRLYAGSPRARELGGRARAILIFPRITKGGFLVGGQFGQGALRVNGHTVGYYRIAAASFGLQAGVQSFSYALFFMTEASLRYLQTSQGWAIGSGPSVVVVDKGMAGGLTSTTLTQDVFAFPFGQKGLMAGLGLEGSKITRIHPR